MKRKLMQNSKKKTDLWLQKLQEFGDLKESRGVIFHDTEEWCEIWRKADLWFGKWHVEYSKFSPEYLNNLKIETLMWSFYPKYKMYELKIYRGVMCQDNEEWCKIWKGIDLSFQNWQEEFDEFWSEHSSLKNVHFNGLLLNKVYNVWARKAQKLRLMAMKIDGKFEGKLTYAFQNDMRIWQTFTRGLEKSQI